MGPMTPDIPCLPLDYEDALRYILEKNAGRYFREARSLTKNENLFEKGVPLANDLKKIGQAVWESRLMLYDDASTLIFTDKAKSDYLNGSTGLGPDFLVDPTQKNESLAIKKQSNWDAVQEAFLSFFICALRNYREYMIYPSKAKDAENVTSYGGAEFREKNFVKSERHDMRDFLNQLLGTQMWDRFVTKRLYGSGSPDIIFFDDSVNQFSKLSTISLFMGRRRLSMDKYLETSATKRKNRSSWTSFRKAGTLNLNQTEQTEVFLLHSASVRSRLKTIVSPDPHLIDVHAFDRNDDKTNNVLESNVKKLEDNQRYVYEEFPWRWNSELLGHPRPLPPAVLAEFDNHGESIVKFRRRKNTEEDHTIIPPDPITLAEVATFNLFFVSFTSVVGDLIIIPSNGTSCALDRSSVPPTNDFTKENSHVSSPRSTLDGADSSKISTETGPRDQTSDNESPVLVQSQSSQEMENTRDDSVCTITSSPRYETARLRFRHSLKYLEIEESKAKAKAALGLAFEILECMKLRKLKAEPESYHCLMDACGKCGDTQRVSQLLVRMHEDGIVADSAVYSSLVTAFSSDTVLNVTTTGIDESYLPGEVYFSLRFRCSLGNMSHLSACYRMG
jgi:pentatricopeptide repeat protein